MCLTAHGLRSVIEYEKIMSKKGKFSRMETVGRLCSRVAAHEVKGTMSNSVSYGQWQNAGILPEIFKAVQIT